MSSSIFLSHSVSVIFIIYLQTRTANSDFAVDCSKLRMGQDGKSFETALLLSIFLGTFGFDRFYLGYPAIGLLKMCTLGFMFLGQLIDIILIATQVVGPADGSNYIISYFGPGITVLKMNNETYKLPQVH